MTYEDLGFSVDLGERSLRFFSLKTLRFAASRRSSNSNPKIFDLKCPWASTPSIPASKSHLASHKISKGAGWAGSKIPRILQASRLFFFKKKCICSWRFTWFLAFRLATLRPLLLGFCFRFQKILDQAGESGKPKGRRPSGAPGVQKLQLQRGPLLWKPWVFSSSSLEDHWKIFRLWFWWSKCTYYQHPPQCAWSWSLCSTWKSNAPMLF